VPDAPMLMPGVRIDRDLAPGQSHTYRLALTAGDFLRVTIEQKGIDVAASVVRPDGGRLIAVDAVDEEFRPEAIVAIADVNGTHTVAIAPSRSVGPRGRYRIHVDELRASTPEDASRIEAERAFERGRTLSVTRQPAEQRKALDEFARALDRYRQVDDRQGEMKAVIELASTQTFLSMPEALASSRHAEEISRRARDDAARARALRVVGNACERAGDRPAALRAYEDSAALSHAIGDSRSEGYSVNNEAIIYGKSGDPERAVATIERALLLLRPLHDDFAGAMLNNLGIAYKDLGQFDKSLHAYEVSLALARARHDRNIEVTLLNNMGSVQRLMGNHDKALELHTTALAVSRQIGGGEHEARALNNIGLTYYMLGDYAKALEYHRDALTMRREMLDVSGEAASLDGAGRALHRLGESDKALDALQEALTIRRRIREQLGESDTLTHLAAVERDRGSLPDALRDAGAAVDLDETLRARITSPELRATYVAAEQNKYQLLIDILQQLHAEHPADDYAAAALRISERARARVLLESLLDARVDLHQGIDPGLLERERSLQQELNDASAQLSRLLAARNNNPVTATASDKLDRLTADYQRLQARIREESPRYAAVTQPRPIDLAGIQQSVVDDDTVLLEFDIGEERSWLWAVTPRTLTTIQLPARRDIEAAARSLYAQFTARQKQPDETSAGYARRVATADARLARGARAFSATLLGGIAKELNGEWRTKRLAIVATGALEYLPFAALPVPEIDRDAAATALSAHRSSVPLAARHEIVMLPSASVLAVLRRDTSGRTRAGRTLAILADPVFDAADPRVVPAAAAGRGNFGRLPFSREEANAIAALAGTGETLKAMDFQASRATALGGALNGARIVHLATHGVLDSERPSLSALIFSLVDEHGMRQNGYVRLPDIYNMRLDADLVALSACQTALGKQIKGEGLVGLTRAFIYAGAMRVVASLWEVNDLATAELMKRFYRGMLQQRLRPAAALRAAQMELARDPRWGAPYFWSGFVLEGEWR
jgi:CHAT domain-containing protein